MRRYEITAGERTIATYVWGDPTREPYALLVHGWSSFGLRFLPWVARLRQAGMAVVKFADILLR
jgi:alpha-beta hydrolase superfamily lysophospholipase